MLKINTVFLMGFSSIQNQNEYMTAEIINIMRCPGDSIGSVCSAQILITDNFQSFDHILKSYFCIRLSTIFSLAYSAFLPIYLSFYDVSSSPLSH